jgi:membrane-associated protease RseP (regulator of RpoE activity)
MDNTFSPPVELFAEDPPRPFPWINVVLFVLTCITTTIVGTALMADFKNTLGESVSGFMSSLVKNPSKLISGLPFSIAIMTILMAHEMGHYLTCRYYKIDASLPYFIPWFTGTMGAFIRIRSRIPDRASLLEVGIAGPIAGFVFAVPAFIIALLNSGFMVLPEHYFGFGEPLIFKVLAALLHKTPPPGMDLHLHPIGYAAWFGFFATALNLLPVGQLDGGHVSYSLLGDLHRKISRAIVFVLIPLGIFYWQGWLVWTTVLLFLGMRHPMTLDDTLPLRRRHVWLGWIGLVMFVLCFTPMPFYVS